MLRSIPSRTNSRSLCAGASASNAQQSSNVEEPSPRQSAGNAAGQGVPPSVISVQRAELQSLTSSLHDFEKERNRELDRVIDAGAENDSVAFHEHLRTLEELKDKVDDAERHCVLAQRKLEELENAAFQEQDAKKECDFNLLMSRLKHRSAAIRDGLSDEDGVLTAIGERRKEMDKIMSGVGRLERDNKVMLGKAKEAYSDKLITTASVLLKRVEKGQQKAVKLEERFVRAQRQLEAFEMEAFNVQDLRKEAEVDSIARKRSRKERALESERGEDFAAVTLRYAEEIEGSLMEAVSARLKEVHKITSGVERCEVEIAGLHREVATARQEKLTVTWSLCLRKVEKAERKIIKLEERLLQVRRHLEELIETAFIAMESRQPNAAQTEGSSSGPSSIVGQRDSEDLFLDAAVLISKEIACIRQLEKLFTEERLRVVERSSEFHEEAMRASVRSWVRQREMWDHLVRITLFRKRAAKTDELVAFYYKAMNSPNGRKRTQGSDVAEGPGRIAMGAHSENSMIERPSCSVCREDMLREENVIALACMHVFHEDCVNPWIEREHTCPLCRTTV